MGNLKSILLVFGVSVLIVVVMAVGLSKLSSGSGGGGKVEVDQLTQGARWVVKTGETKVVVVEFSDMQCPACKLAEPISEGLRKMEGVEYIYRNFPLVTIHKNAWKAARALEAARIMGKGWEMMALLFEKQDEWSGLSEPESKLVSYAKNLGLDEESFLKEYRSDETDKLVGEDYDLGNGLRLSGTPTFFVDGRQVAANYVLTKVKELLKQ